MNGWRLSRRKVLWWAALGIAAAGCLSPTLPLPPPAPPDVAKVGEGQYLLRGSIPTRGTVFIRHARQSSDVNSRTDVVYGKWDVIVYDIVVAAQPGDDMIVWYTVGNDESDAVPFRIDRDPTPPEAGSPSPPPSDAGND